MQSSSRNFGNRISLYLGKNDLSVKIILNGEDSDHFMFVVVLEIIVFN